MNLWTCPDHGLTGPRACCEKASRVFNVVEPPTDPAITSRRSLPRGAETVTPLELILADFRRLIEFAKARKYGHVNVPIPDLEAVLDAADGPCRCHSTETP